LNELVLIGTLDELEPEVPSNENQEPPHEDAAAVENQVESNATTTTEKDEDAEAPASAPQ
jgi:hypothetical protein